MAKIPAKLTIGFAAIAVVTWSGTSSGQAYGDAPWCAVVDRKGEVYWDCTNTALSRRAIRMSLPVIADFAI